MVRPAGGSAEHATAGDVCFDFRRFFAGCLGVNHGEELEILKPQHVLQARIRNSGAVELKVLQAG